MLLVLTGITVVAGIALGYVHALTLAPIEAATKAKQEDAIKAVAPVFNNSPAEEKREVTLDDGSVITIFPAKMDGKEVGAAVETFSAKGFGGNIRIMVGFDQDGTIRNYSVLQHAETPGLGSKMQEWFCSEKGKQSILGKNPATANLTVSKDGGDVDAITAATISSRAFLDAVQKAYQAYAGQTDGRSGSTRQSHDGESGATTKTEQVNE